MQSVLPVECEFSEEELRDRIRLGVLPGSPGEYLSRVRIESADQVRSDRKKRKELKLDVNQDSLEHILRKRARKCTKKQEIAESTIRLNLDLRILKEFGSLRRKLKMYVEIKDSEESESRLQIPLIPKRSENRLWKMLLFGTNGFSQEEVDKAQSKKKTKLNLSPTGISPKTSFLVFIDYGTICVLLATICWETKDFSDKRRLAWIYALMARLERPFDSNLEAALTKLHRELKQQPILGTVKEARVILLLLESEFKISQ